jgi:hypothetical protein
MMTPEHRPVHSVFMYAFAYIRQEGLWRHRRKPLGANRVQVTSIP